MRIKPAITSKLASLLLLSQTQTFAADFVAIVMMIPFEIWMVKHSRHAKQNLSLAPLLSRTWLYNLTTHLINFM